MVSYRQLETLYSKTPPRRSFFANSLLGDFLDRASALKLQLWNWEMFYRPGFRGSHMAAGTEWKLNWSVQCVKVRCAVICKFIRSWFLLRKYAITNVLLVSRDMKVKRHWVWRTCAICCQRVPKPQFCNRERMLPDGAPITSKIRCRPDDW